MSLRSALLSLAAFALLLTPSASRADEDTAQASRLADSWGISNHGHPGPQRHPGRGWGAPDNRGGGRDGDWDDDDHGAWGNHVHGQHCNHSPAPPRPWPRQGRYELQTVQRWVPGRYEQVWVPEVCRVRPRLNRTVCKGGFYDRQWVAGHYETAQEWVWVSASPRRGFSVAVGG